jgi:succinate dehydrogenase hydrophobic anchor subunit
VSRDASGPDDRIEGQYLLLERITALVLLLVMVSLGWIVAAANFPSCAEWATPEWQVGIVLVLLTAALLLVSVLALLHTRG